jgi:hypothetical protein
MMEHFDPVNDVIDKRILYEITNRKEKFDRYSDETSSDDDESESLNPFIGIGVALKTSLVNSRMSQQRPKGRDDGQNKENYSLND